MKALTLHQPYASLIARGVKTIETRTWPAPAGLIGERIAIHAGKNRRGFKDLGLTGWRSFDDPGPWHGLFGKDPDQVEGFVISYSDDGDSWVANPETDYWPSGAVVATARLAACVPMFDTWDLVNIWDTEHCIQLARSPYTGEIEGFYEWLPGEDKHGYRDGGGGDEDQIKFGNFEPGNWGWMLEDVEPCDPIPAKGFQRVWNFDEAVAA